MKTLLKIILLSSVMLSSSAYSFTQCTRPVNLIWNSMTGSNAVWVTFSDGGSAIFKTEAQLTEGQMARFVSFALTAQASDRELIVRYPENGLQCPPTGAARNDAEGIWIKPN